MSRTITKNLHFRRGRRSKKAIQIRGASTKPKGRVPRVARLMALAIRFDQMIRDGVVKDQAELARLGHVTRARLTQIMNLPNLAPDIQEAILYLPPVECGPDPVSERDLRPNATVADWRKQWWMYHVSHEATTTSTC